ncbi:MAG: NAD(P)-binding domain-containing protein, partial [Myxococcota bacterium]
MSDLLNKLEDNSAVVGVVGLGYVGLPLMITFGRKNVRVLGFDIDARKIDHLHRGESYIEHIPSEPIAALVNDGLLEATDDFSRISEVDAVLLCVPTPLNTHREPDMTYVEGTAKNVGPYLRKEQIVILESTTYPG